MLQMPLFDMGGMLFFLLFGLVIFIITMIIVIICEAIVLWKIKWGSFVYSLLVSLIANIASTAAGFAIAYISYVDIPALVIGFVDGLRWLLLTWIGSVLIEGSVMTLFKWGRWKRNAIAVVLMNSISYILLAIIGLIL